MNANEFSLDRVDALHNIASATPAANDKEKKHQKEPRPARKAPKGDEKDGQPDSEGLTVPLEKHAIDFQA